MGLLNKYVGGLTSANAEKLQKVVPMGDMPTIRNLPEASQIHKMTNLPNLKACNESRALRAKKEAEMMKANLHFMREIASAQQSKITTQREAVEERLKSRQHGMKETEAVVKSGADHRLKSLAMGYAINEQKARVSAWEQVSNVSAEIIQF